MSPRAPDSDPRHAPFPLTDMQQAYTVGQDPALELGGVSALVYTELELGPIDPGRMDAAWGEVVGRHEMLRAVFTGDGQQRVLEDATPATIPVCDHRRVDDPGAALARLRQEMKQRRVKLDRWPLIDIRLSVEPGERWRLHLGLPIPLMDASSAHVMLHDLARAYEEPGAERSPLALSFRDCVAALRQLASGERLEAARAYWLEQVQTLPLGPELPLARRLGQMRGHTFVRRTATLSAEVFEALQAKAARRNLTASQIVLAGYAEALSLWSKSPAFSIVFLQTDRVPDHPQIHEVVGNFSSTMLIDYDRRPRTFADRVKRMSARYQAAAAHRHYSGVRVLRRIVQARRLPPRAMVPVTAVSGLGMAPRRQGPGALSRLGWREVESYLSVPQVLIDHQFFRVGQGELLLSMVTVDEAFPPGFGDDFMATYVDVLHRLADSLKSWLRSGGPPLPPHQSERRRQVNATEAPLPAGLLHEGFFARAARQPGRTALVSPRRELSYGELDRAARAVARRLRDEGARAGELVAVVMDKGWEQVAAVLGILAAGGAYLPVDPGLPAERRTYMIEHGQARLVLTQPWLDGELTWPGGVTRLPVDDAVVAQSPGEAPPAARGPQDLAYVIFTSGSTGLPKGVMIDHRGALNTCRDINARMAVEPADRVFGISSLSFDLSVYDIFGVLGAGGALVLPEAARQKDPEHWSELAARHDVTIWNSTPTLMELLVEQHESREQPLPGALRVVMMSGDWIPISLPARIRALSERAALYSLGGATEASIWSILHPIEQIDPGWRSVPYGKPMRNQRFHVLNESLRPCPDWVPGQLVIGGVGVALGYWRDEQRTRASFITLPGGEERHYCTGDLGRYLPDGNIEFLGREDSQVKIRGYRIELGEIEATLQAHEDVKEAVVVVRERDGSAGGRRREDPGAAPPVEGGDRMIVAYYVPAEGTAAGGELDPGELQRFLGRKLPQYMIPTALVPLERIPLTPNGKVDRRALPRPALAGEAGAAEAAPADELERAVAEIWHQVLGSPVGLEDNFFDIGGHSALAVRVVALVRRKLGHEIPAAAMLRGTTVRQLARLLRERRQDRSCLVEVTRAGGRAPFYCVHPVSGSVLCYAELARSLGPDRPFVGLQARGLLDPAGSHPSIEEMAEHYVGLVRQHAGGASYLLGGWSMGGTIALEMARQLRSAGEEVAAVAVIDSVPEQQGAPVARDEVHYMEWFIRDLAGMAGRPTPVERAQLARTPRGQRLTVLLEAARELGSSPFNDEAELQTYFRVFQLNGRALEAYRWPPYGGPAAVFAARDGEAGGARVRWSGLVGELSWHELPGDHFTLMQRPVVAQLAARLRGYLWD